METSNTFRTLSGTMLGLSIHIFVRIKTTFANYFRVHTRGVVIKYFNNNHGIQTFQALKGLYEVL